MGALGGRIARGVARAALSLLTWCLAASLIVLAAGTAAGRWRVWPVHDMGAHTGVSSHEALLLVPVVVSQVHDRDLVVMARDKHKPALFRVKTMLDNVRGEALVLDEHGTPQDVKLPAKVWRVSHDLPYAGLLLKLLAGPVQAVMFVLGGIVLIARAESRRRREDEGTPGAEPPRGPRWRRASEPHAAPTA